MIRRLLLVLALGSALGVGMVAGPADAAPPAVGSCHRLTLEQAWNQHSDPAAPVPCSSRHTTQTIGVPVSTVSLVGLSDEAISQLASQACGRLLRKIWGPRLLAAQSMYSAWVFAPTPAEIAAGEHWFRCDVGLSGYNNLQPLRGRLTFPLIRHRVPDAVRKCFAGKVLTTCNHRHTQRSIGAFNLTAKAMSSRAAFRQLAHRKCPGATGYVFPTADALKAGYRVTVCYQRTTH